MKNENAFDRMEINSCLVFKISICVL